MFGLIRFKNTKYLVAYCFNLPLSSQNRVTAVVRETECYIGDKVVETIYESKECKSDLERWELVVT